MQTGEIISTTEHILALRNYPRKSAYIAAALEDVRARFGSVPEAARAVVEAYFADAAIQEEPRRRLPENVWNTLFQAIATGNETITLCAGPCCIEAGSDRLAKQLTEYPAAQTADMRVERQHCMGACHLAPNAKVGSQTIAQATVDKIRAQIKR